MPRRSKISPAMRTEWLDAHDRGERIDKIARNSNRTERTVRDHIQKATQEREAQLVRADLLKEAYRKHFEELLEAAREIRDNSKRRNGNDLLQHYDKRLALLIAGLKEHTPRAKFWKLVRDWKGAVNRKESAGRATGYAIDEKVETVEKETSLPIAFKDLKPSLLNAAGMEDISRLHYRAEGGNSGEKLYAGLVSWVRSTDGSDRLRGAERDLKRISGAIEDEVNLMLLRRIFSGQCKLCNVW